MLIAKGVPPESERDDDKMVSDGIWTLGPGRSVALTKQMLGQDICRRPTTLSFGGMGENELIFLYVQNTHVRISPKDIKVLTA